MRRLVVLSPALPCPALPILSLLWSALSIRTLRPHECRCFCPLILSSALLTLELTGPAPRTSQTLQLPGRPRISRPWLLAPRSCPGSCASLVGLGMRRKREGTPVSATEWVPGRRITGDQEGTSTAIRGGGGAVLAVDVAHGLRSAPQT